MSEIADDSAASDGPAVAAPAGLGRHAPKLPSIGEATDSIFLTWDDQERLEYLKKLDRVWRDNRNEVELDFAVKERLTQLLRLERQLTNGNSNNELTSIKSIFPTAARHVEAVSQRIHRASRRKVSLFLAAVVLMSFGATAIWAWWIDAHHGLAFLAFSVTEILIAYIVVILMVIRFATGEDPRRHPVAVPIMAYLAAVLSATCIVALIFTSLFRRGQYPGTFLELAGGVGLVIVLAVLTLWCFIRIAVRINRLHCRDTRPSEFLLVDLVALASDALSDPFMFDDGLPLGHLYQIRYSRSRLAPPFIDRLEAAAKRAEWMFASNIPRGHSDLRPWAVDRAQRVAAVLRAHKRVLLEVPDLGNSSISSSLFNGVIYVAQANWDAFLVVQPEPVVRSFLRRFAGRIVLAALLAIGALSIPWLFPSLVPPTAAAEFRATLLVTAAFSLVRPDLDKAREAFSSFRT